MKIKFAHAWGKHRSIVRKVRERCANNLYGSPRDGCPNPDGASFPQTNGRVAYVYVPDTGNGGFTSFNRYFFAQVGKEAVIVDERFNKGGQLADYIVDYLNRKLLNRVVTREGSTERTPALKVQVSPVVVWPFANGNTSLNM